MPRTKQPSVRSSMRLHACWALSPMLRDRCLHAPLLFCSSVGFRVCVCVCVCVCVGFPCSHLSASLSNSAIVACCVLAKQITQLKAEASLARARGQEDDRKGKNQLEKSLAEASAAQDEAIGLKVCLRIVSDDVKRAAARQQRCCRMQ